MKSGLISGLSCVTVGCAGFPFNSESSPATAGSTPTSPIPSASIMPSPQENFAEDSEPIESEAEAAIWAALQQGEGYVVMMRHALAPGTGDPPEFQIDDCTTQRNLSPAGRQQAKAIGAAFRQRNIPVRQVLSSQWCRCLETARLLDLGDVQPFPALNSFFSDRSTAAQQTEQVGQFIREQKDQPGVTILVTHQVNITAISNIVPASGEFIVLHAAGNSYKNGQQNGRLGAIEVVGKLSPIPIE